VHLVFTRARCAPRGESAGPVLTQRTALARFPRVGGPRRAVGSGAWLPARRACCTPREVNFSDGLFFLSRVEKRYLIATKIFDTFFDSGENAARGVVARADTRSGRCLSSSTWTVFFQRGRARLSLEDNMTHHSREREWLWCRVRNRACRSALVGGTEQGLLLQASVLSNYDEGAVVE
jgi:hypothetical protein